MKPRSRRLPESHGISRSTFARQIGSDRSAGDAALAALIEKYANGWAFEIAEVYALRGDATATFEWLDRAWSTRDAGIAGLLYDPFILRYKDDPRFAALPQGRAARAGRDEAADVISIRVGQEPPVQAIQRGTEVSPIAAGLGVRFGQVEGHTAMAALADSGRMPVSTLVPKPGSPSVT